MAYYNGHVNYNAWNVSLWLNNDEHLYSIAKLMLRKSNNKDDAAKRLLALLPETTPDGVKYTVTNVRKALVGME